MHALSAVLIYTSAIYDCFLFHTKHNFTLLTLKGSPVFMGISAAKEFRIISAKTYCPFLFSIRDYSEVHISEYFSIYIVRLIEQQGLKSNRTNTTTSLLQ